MLRSCSQLGSTLAVAGGLVYLSGCGAGTAAIVDAASGGGGGGGNAPPAISAFRVEEAKESPARVAFLLSDRESNPVQVEIFFQLAGAAPEAITQIPGLPTSFDTTRDGIEYGLDWDFTGETGIPADGSFTPDITVFATLVGGVQEIVPGANAEALGVGNDSPVIVEVREPQEEASGIAFVELTVSDSSDDLIDIAVEFDVVGDDPDAGWQLARPAGEVDTPELAFKNILAEKTGTDLRFFWDTDVDLADEERDVRLRFTPVDPVATGTPIESGEFRVDNNEEPIAIPDGAALVGVRDQKRGIPLPFEIVDPESDPVRLVFQWRRPTQSFDDPELRLPDDPVRIEAILDDPVERERFQVCTERPLAYEGRVSFAGTVNELLLPELFGPAAGILGSGGLVGRELEILRSPNAFERVSEAWSSNPLTTPAALLPADDGPTALVLDGAGAGTWRLREVDLATGAVVRTLVDSFPSGDPSAMTREREAGSVLVASAAGGPWSVHRVKLENGEVTELVRSEDGTTELGKIRGIASLSPNTAVVTVASSLVGLDFATVPGRAVQLLAGLQEPWGVVVDPLRPNGIYLAEHGDPVGRVLAIDLDAHAVRPVVATRAGGASKGFTKPQAVALERSGARLLVGVQNPADGTHELRSLELGRSDTAETVTLAAGFAQPIGALATGPDGLRLLAFAGRDDLVVAGGLEQRRDIVDYDGVRRTVTVDPAFDPVPATARRWRIFDRFETAGSSPKGKKDVFVWDSDDLVAGGEAFLRITPLDSEKGLAGNFTSPKRVEPVDFDRIRQLEVEFGVVDVAAADIDGDGDLDLLAGNYYDCFVAVFFQSTPGVFGQGGRPDLILEDDVGTFGPSSVAAADIDADGAVDLVSANEDGENVAIFFQSGTGSFDDVLILGDDDTTSEPASVAIADLDDDGRLDIVTANSFGDNLTIFFQTGPRTFDDVVFLGDCRITFDPVSVAAADLDGDGRLDIVSANDFGDSLTLFFQTGPRAFDDYLILGDDGTTLEPVSVAAADLDGDGRLDIVSANEVGDNLTIFFQTGPRAFDDLLALGDNSTTPQPESVTAADLDGDGDLDLVATSRGDDDLVLFYQTAPGVFTISRAGPLGGTNITDDPLATVVADLDGDGDLDIVSANFDGGDLVVFLRTSPGRFTLDPSGPLGNATVTRDPDVLVAADLDADGDLDLVSANDEADNLTIFFQSSPGIFTLDPSGPLGGAGVTENPKGVAAGDLDGDGDLDLVSGNKGGDNLIIFFQSSPGIFTLDPSGPLGGAGATEDPKGVAVADFDADSRLDIVCANDRGNNLTIFMQTDQGGFGLDGDRTRPNVTLGSSNTTRGPEVVAVADLDGDGDADVACANRDGNTLAVFLQIDRGVFGENGDPQQPNQTLGGTGLTDGAIALAVADLDGDSDLDIVSANRDGDTLTIFMQTLPGVFTFDPNGPLGGSSTTQTAEWVAAADLDADGDLDLVSANDLPDTLTIFFQTAPGVFTIHPDGPLGNPQTTPGPESVVAADLDGDGDADIVSANGEGHNLTIFYGIH